MSGDHEDVEDEGMEVEESNKAPTLVLDKKAESSFIQAFRDLPAKVDDTIRLFERSDFYTAHDDDAHFIAQHVFKTTTVIKQLGGEGSRGLAGVCMSRMQTTSFLREMLLEKQKRVEVYVMDRSKNRWVVKQRGSPGNLQAFEDILFSSASTSESAASPVVIAIKVGAQAADGTRPVGVAFADATARSIGMSSLTDTETFAALESLVVQLSARECLLPEVASDDSADAYTHKKVLALLDRCGVVATPTKRSLFNTKNAEADLSRLLRTPAALNVAAHTQQSLACAAALVAFLDLMSDDANLGRFALSEFDATAFMRLDASAVKALNILPPPGVPANSTSSLYGLFNRCQMAQGSRTLLRVLKQPLVDVAAIEARQDIVEAFFSDAELRTAVRDEHLRRIPDLSRLAKRFERRRATLQDTVRLYQAIAVLPALADALSRHDGSHAARLSSTYTAPIKECAEALERYQQLIETTVDLERVRDHEFVVRAEYDEALAALGEQLAQMRKREFPRILSKAADDLGLEAHKKLKLEHSAVHGHHLRVARTDGSKLRGKPLYTELSTQKQGVLFTTRELRAVSERYEDVSQKYASAQADVVKQVIDVCASYCPVIETLGEVLAMMDVMAAFADVAAHAPAEYVRPKVVGKESGEVTLVEARHPCIEAQDGVAFIPNDIALSHAGFDVALVTGPNMGGKSTFIRQIGVLVLLAQCGSFVPATSATISVRDAILARVGAGDSQLQGVSTFMAEMLEAAAILRTASRDSLVIVDELGRGTSTYDGFGLAWAIAEHLASAIKCTALFATHFHELTAMANEHSNVQNLHVTAHATEKDITLLYKVQQGPSDQSFGIHVAKLAHFPDTVVALAKRKADELEDESGGKVRRVEASEEEREEADREMEEFLKRVAAVKNEKELPEKVKVWGEELRKRNNPVIQSILAEL